jgi:hypothetical protein
MDVAAATARGLALVLLLLGISRCATGSERNATGDQLRATSIADATTGTPVHTCDHRSLGEGGATGRGDRTPAPDWRSRSVVVGPLGFLDLPGFAAIPAAHFDPGLPTSYANNGIVFVVILEARHSATIEIAEKARDAVLLLDTARTSPLQGPHPSLVDGVTAVRLEACPTVDTAFYLALIPTRPHCVPFDISTSQTVAATRVVLPLGTQTCSQVGVSVGPRLTG